jgi:hypothetical protein
VYDLKWIIWRQAFVFVVTAVGCMVPRSQPNAENFRSAKLKVDNAIWSAYMLIIDICLLSFGYRAFGTAP